MILFLLSASILALAELVGDHTAGEGAATGDDAGTEAEQPIDSEVAPDAAQGPASGARAEEDAASAGGPADEPVLELPPRAFAGVLAVGGAVLFSLLWTRSRKWLLPPPRLVPRATWGLEQFAYGLALSMALTVVGALAALALAGENVLAAGLVLVAAQCASCGAVVALVLTRPSILPMWRPGGRGALTPRLSARGGAGASGRARLASLGVWLRDPGVNLLRGVAAGAGATPLAVGAAWVGALLCELADVVPREHPVVTGLRSAGPGEIVALVFLACVGAPLVEELLFRGFLYSTLRDLSRASRSFKKPNERSGALLAAVASSLAFGAVHPGGPNQAATFALGLALCAVYERGGTLVAPVVAHAAFNAIQVALVLIARAG